MTDYSRTKLSALQALAGGGDQAAAEELARRGVDKGAPLDVTKLDYLGLRALVLRWNEGVMPEDRARSRELAERAQAELEVRYRVDLKLWKDGRGDEPRQPPAPPWTAPREPRTRDWRRPGSSKLYPGPGQEVSAVATEFWRRAMKRAAGEPWRGDSDD